MKHVPAPLLLALALFAALAAWAAPNDGETPGARGGVPATKGDHAMTQASLVDELRRQGIVDPAVLAAIGRVPRHEFVPASLRDEAYANYPLSIGEGQTISQPYIVAFMTEAAELQPTSNVLEVGTGSGYQAAILADVLGLGPEGGSAAKGRLASIEIIPSLAESAKALLHRLGYEVEVRVGDGYGGWPERGPFDAILVTAAPDHVPAELKQQLKLGGRLIIPVGAESQQMTIITRTEKSYRVETVLPVRFVPMTGEAQYPR